MRTLSGTLEAAQQAATGLSPYIRLRFYKGASYYDYTTRLKKLIHVEEPYNSYAQIVLDNHDLAVENLTGYWIDIGYGYTTGSGDEYSSAPRLWVVQQSNESEEGRLESILYLEGIWTILSTVQDIGGLGGEIPYLQVTLDGTIYTVYDLLEIVLEQLCNVDLDALGSVDDEIIDTLMPVFEINAAEGLFEDAASIIYRLMNLTLCYLRPKGNYGGSKLAGFSIIHPQEDLDAVDYEYYSDLSYGHGFWQSFWKDNTIHPAHVYVIANQDAVTGEWPDVIVGEADYSDEEGFYDEDGNLIDNPEYHIASTLRTQEDADNRAEVIYRRNWYETEWGVVVVPHNCGQELYDKVAVYDLRGT